mmetsp:Transcript_44460/g.125763  ORF Transcript_44460/g.125763 Transcript_44460/m.125763 type:complete len:354 (+) Transcript_44460:475-1536(+)
MSAVTCTGGSFACAYVCPSNAMQCSDLCLPFVRSFVPIGTTKELTDLSHTDKAPRPLHSQDTIIHPYATPAHPLRHSFDHQVDNLLWHINLLDHPLPLLLNPRQHTSHPRVIPQQSQHGLPISRNSRRHLQLPPQLPVDLHRHGDRVLHKQVFPVGRPLGCSADGVLWEGGVEDGPQLFAYVGGEGAEQQHQGGGDFSREVGPLVDGVEELHRGRDGVVELESLDVLRHALDQLVQRLELISCRLPLRAATPTIRRDDLPPQPVEEAVDALHALGAPWLDALQRAHEHQIQPQRVRPGGGDDVVRVDDIAPALAHLLAAGDHLDGRVGLEHEGVTLLDQLLVAHPLWRQLFSR